MRSIRTIRTTAAVVVVAMVTVLAGACSDDDGPGDAMPELRLVSSLERFASCDEVRQWARDELAPRVGAYGFPGGAILAEGDLDVATAEEAAEGGPGAAPEAPGAGGDAEARSSAPADAAAPPSDGAGANDAAGTDTGAAADDQSSASTPHSDTNVQVEGVDEPDIVKTDGDRILAVAEGRLHLASPREGRILDSVDLPEGVYDGEMLLAGDRVLLVASSSYAVPATAEEVAVDDVGRSIVPPLNSTRVVQVDIAGDQLTVSETVEVDGNYVSARMTDDVVRLVLHADPQQRLPFVTPANPTPESEAQAQELNRTVVEQAAAEDFMPQWRRLDDRGGVADEGALVGCEQAHAPEAFAGFGMVTVVSIDLSEGASQGLAAANGAGVMAGGEMVYASPEHLYVAAPAWVDVDDPAEPTPRDAERADDLDVPQPGEQGTDIHRFDISDPTRAAYEMSGHVDGVLLNQFAMDEHDGNLRVATTTGSAGAEGEDESDNHVVVLAPVEGGEALGQVGAVSGLGRGETIHSVRFLGDVGYVVTFRQTDPLFTLDLANPAQPRVAGELHILGYSAYLHPVGDGRLIGVGQDATESGSQLGTQVALFDVRDPAAPTRVAQATLPTASSQAEWDHRAFLWWPDTELVAIPVSSYEGDAPFEGIVGYRVDVQGDANDDVAITEVGRVSHPGDPVIDQPVPLPEPVPLPIEPDSGGGSSGRVGGTDIAPEILPYPTPIQRALVIGDRLWTVSGAGLASSDLATLGSTTFIPFA